MTPMIGIGAIIINTQGQFLLGKRCSSHAPYWALPGGKMELGETFEQTAQREVKEETAIDITYWQVIGLTNNLTTYHDEGVHYASVILTCAPTHQQPQLCEPDKCECWIWTTANALPEPLFEGTRQAIINWQAGLFYQPKKELNRVADID